MSKATVILFGVVVMMILFLTSTHVPSIKTLVYGYLGPDVHETRILFVGDVMLGRHVETLIRDHGDSYPFVGLTSLTNRYDYLVGNFEAPITTNHIQTKNNSFSFSVATSSIGTFKDYFSLVSLANNHTYDAGEDSLLFTHATLKDSGVETFGDPNKISTSSVAYYQHANATIALIALNAVSDLSTTSASQLLQSLITTSSMQIVYIHWGEEYEPIHNSEQENIAHLLIDNGADVIIGHHPHVVQDIAFYKGAPIFYSLGNFIFDQYFSDEVQVGLGVELVLSNHDISYTLIPFTTRDSKSSPRLMTVDERQAFLDVVRAKSGPNIAEQLRDSGTIYMTDALASL